MSSQLVYYRRKKKAIAHLVHVFILFVVILLTLSQFIVSFSTFSFIEAFFFVFFFDCCDGDDRQRNCNVAKTSANRRLIMEKLRFFSQLFFALFYFFSSRFCLLLTTATRYTSIVFFSSAYGTMSKCGVCTRIKSTSVLVLFSRIILLNYKNAIA